VADVRSFVARFDEVRAKVGEPMNKGVGLDAEGFFHKSVRKALAALRQE
jgi:hypothetical protein